MTGIIKSSDRQQSTILGISDLENRKLVANHMGNLDIDDVTDSNDVEDSTGRKRPNALERLFPRVNQKVLVPKAFYTSFYTGIGALFPYLPVYFKQLHLTPHQTGVLIGARPLIQFLATPIWGAIADRFCKGKVILLMSVLGWLVSNALLAFAPETEHTRLCDFQPELEPMPEKSDDVTLLLRRSYHGNTTLPFNMLAHKHFLNYQRKDTVHSKMGPAAQLSKRKTYAGLSSSAKTWTNRIRVQSQNDRRKNRRNSTLSRFGATFQPNRQPWSLELMEQPLDDFHGNITAEPKVFTFLFVVTVIGTLISAPTHMMADTATLTTLEGQLHKYGQIRLWGSLGWGVGGFSVGAAVSTNHQTRCNGEVVIDYFPCFYVYIVAMATAFVCATQFEYKAERDNTIQDACEKSSIKNALRVFRRPQHCFVLVIAFFCGSATGFIETFLFWYLHELGGDQFLFSVINGMNCAAEVLVFLITDRLISSLGQIYIIYLALMCYAIRFLYFYFLASPWWVLPAELLQGITTAAFWAACVSYVGLQPGASHTLQGILNGVYMGLGFAAGGFLGGAVVHLIGMPDAFLVYAVGSVLLLLVFIALNKARGGDN